jgi:hypothetical protein
VTLDKIVSDIRAAKCAGFCYEQTGRPRFRDRVTVFCDGRLLFERFCYGEAAGKACEMWAPGLDEKGRVLWNYDACPYSQKTDAPQALTGAGTGGLVFDGKTALWACVDKKKTDPAHGYSGWKVLWLRLRGH